MFLIISKQDLSSRIAKNTLDKSPEKGCLRITTVLEVEGADICIFCKPTAPPFRRMAVVLLNGKKEAFDLAQEAKSLAVKISMHYN